MSINNEVIAGIVVKNCLWISNSATMLYQTQWASAASAAQNEKELAEYQKIAESCKYNINQNGSSIVLSREDDITSPFYSVIEGGMGAPLSGGNNGYAKNPDGSTYLSAVPTQLQGTPLPEYAKVANPVSDGVQIMLESLVPEWVNETVTSSKSEISETVKDDLVLEVQSMFN